jgi:hypothetical protein
MLVCEDGWIPKGVNVKVTAEPKRDRLVITQSVTRTRQLEYLKVVHPVVFKRHPGNSFTHTRQDTLKLLTLVL